MERVWVTADRTLFAGLLSRLADKRPDDLNGAYPARYRKFTSIARSVGLDWDRFSGAHSITAADQ